MTVAQQVDLLSTKVGGAIVSYSGLHGQDTDPKLHSDKAIRV